VTQDSGPSIDLHCTQPWRNSCEKCLDLSTPNENISWLTDSQALIHSQFCGPRHLPELRAIKTCTYGIFFFGTPHAGSNSASWGVAILNIASLFANINTSMIKHLQTNSEWLRQSMDQFSAISGDFEIKYCYEQYKTPLALGKSTLV